MSQHHFLWARLNSYGMFLALLAFASGMFGLFDPQSSSLPGSGTPHRDVAFMLQAVGYTIGGASLMLGFLRERVWPELLGLPILTAATVAGIWRMVIAFGWASDEALSAYILFIIVGGTSALRISGLASRDGTAVILGPGYDDDSRG